MKSYKNIITVSFLFSVVFLCFGCTTNVFVVQPTTPTTITTSSTATISITSSTDTSTTSVSSSTTSTSTSTTTTSSSTTTTLPGEQIAVTITLRGSMNVANNRYFLVMSSTSGLSVPLPPPDNPYYYEMLEPGTNPINNSIADYYRNYYSTWSGYVMANTDGYFAVKGPFVSEEAITHESLATLGDLTTTMRFIVPINNIFATTPSTIYFDVVTVNWPDGLPKIPADHLATANAYIANISGAYVVVEDSLDASIDPALDILSCSVEVQ